MDSHLQLFDFGRNTKNLALDIDALRVKRSEYGLGLPMTLIASGATVACYFGLLALLQTVVWDTCDRCDNWTYNYAPILVAMLGGATTVGGYALLTNRLDPFPDLGHQIKDKQRQLTTVRASLSESNPAAERPVGLSLSMLF